MKKFVMLFIFILFLGGVFALCEEGQIDINTALAEELDNLYGIGLVKADAIINSRPFSSVDGLIGVSGIGDFTLTKIKEQGLACVEEETSEETQEPIEETSEEPNEAEEEITEQEKQEPLYETSSNNYKTPIQSEVIKLNTQNIKSENNKESSDKSNYAKYGFVIFCVLLGLLLILRKNKLDKNEFY